MPHPNEGVYIRIYNPSVGYFEDPFVDIDALYIPGEEVVFSVVRQCPSNWVEQIRSEIYWIFPEEIRLLASIALSIPEGRGTLAFVPNSHQLIVDTEGEELSGSGFINKAKELAFNVARDTFGKDVRYRLRGADTSGEEFRQRLFQGINVSNSLLIRGLSCLLKSQHLMAADLHAFCEDAFINVQIAREAVLQLIRKLLEEEGIESVSYNDIYKYIEENFRMGNLLAASLKEQYEKWISAKHPNSRWGLFWTPPLSAEDFFETYESLVSVFRHLITGEPGGESADL